jgi:hypothetical protein
LAEGGGGGLIMTEELPPPQAAARRLNVAMSSQAPVQIGSLSGWSFPDLRNSNDDEYEMGAMAISGPQLILAERLKRHEVNS